MVRIKKVFIIAIPSILTAILIVTLGVLAGQNRPSKRSDFPVLRPSSAYLLKDSTFEELINISEVFVESEVTQVYPIETREFIPVPGTPEAMAYEKMGITSSYYDVLKVDMKTKDCLKGSIGKTFTLSVVALNLESAPDFKVGDRFLLALEKYIDGSYRNVTSVSSYFFIAHDDMVYPAGEDPWMQQFNGMGLTEFKQEAIAYI